MTEVPLDTPDVEQLAVHLLEKYAVPGVGFDGQACAEELEMIVPRCDASVLRTLDVTPSCAELVQVLRSSRVRDVSAAPHDAGPVTVHVATVGAVVEVTMPHGSTVAVLRAQLPQCGISTPVYLFNDGVELCDTDKLSADWGHLWCQPAPFPEWAADDGWEMWDELPRIVRRWYSDLGTGEVPGWARNDDEVWLQQKHRIDGLEEAQSSRNAWFSFCYPVVDGVKRRIVRAEAGKSFQLTVEGTMWNRNNDTCIHQVLCGLDEAIVLEVGQSVPTRPTAISESAEIAGKDAGIYVLHVDTDLQYNMPDARRNKTMQFQNQGKCDRYQQSFRGFIGFVVVE
mmetsp:Transcript_52438/g.139085  ORF Transcript_52438/g.139085 Transcript_52438/m.139085 type:complete len:340 (-) Transcript_52438:310-1329(-)